MEFLRDHPQLLLLGGLLLITMYLMSRLAKRRRRGSASIVTPHEQLERLKQARGMRGDLEQLMVEIEQMAKRMSAHLDAKSMRIERLLQDADERIEKLQALQQNKTGRVEPAASVEAQSSDATPAAPAEPAADALPDDPLARSVYELADQGIEPNQIARQLDEHVGKVELILALRSA